MHRRLFSTQSATAAEREFYRRLWMRPIHRHRLVQLQDFSFNNTAMIPPSTAFTGLPFVDGLKHRFSRWLGGRICANMLGPFLMQRKNGDAGVVWVDWHQQWIQGAMQAYWLWLHFMDMQSSMKNDDSEDSQLKDSEENHGDENTHVLLQMNADQLVCPYLGMKQKSSTIASPSSIQNDNDTTKHSIDMSRLFDGRLLRRHQSARTEAFRRLYPPIQHLSQIQGARFHDIRIMIKLNPNGLKSRGMDWAEQLQGQERCTIFLNHSICLAEDMRPILSSVLPSSVFDESGTIPEFYKNADALKVEMDVWFDVEYTLPEQPQMKFRRVASITMQSDNILFEKNRILTEASDVDGDEEEDGRMHMHWTVTDVDQQLAAEEIWKK